VIQGLQRPEAEGRGGEFPEQDAFTVLGIGEAAADILGTILQKTERFIVIPQQDMESILSQQRLGATGAINPDTAAKMGQILGLNAIVTGSITAYSETEEGYDYLVSKGKKQIARVTVDYRIVDTTTGVQLLADSGAGIYEKSAGSVLGMGPRRLMIPICATALSATLSPRPW